MRPERKIGPPLGPGSIRDGAAELPVALSAEQSEQLAAFAALLLRWNAVYNLTAIRDPQRLLTHHLLDCLAIVPVFDELARPGLRILDVGSGGGLPAIPLAIARPAWAVTAIDAVDKKCAFIRHARAELKLQQLEVVHGRVESQGGGPDMPPFHIITSRAFASLADFVTGSRHLLRADGHWAALKGSAPNDEIDALPADVQVGRTVKLRIPQLDEQRHLLLLERANTPSPPASLPN